MQTIPVRTATESYNVLLGAGLLASAARHILEASGGAARRCFVITSPEIWSLWSEPFLSSFAAEERPLPLFLPPGEEHKRMATLEQLAEALSRAGADRSSMLLAFGGGVIGDLAGFLAAIYMRGLPYIQIPTTLLAQVDSSVGGKTGVNLAAGKNLIGAFHHPRLVLADTTVLGTLPQREFRAGLAESLKAGLIRNAALFSYMAEHRTAILAQDNDALLNVIGDSIRMKADVVALDERESGLRMVLNFGHTVGHALETVTGYTALLHGEAVVWGMLVALEISRMRGLLPPAGAAVAAETIRAYGLAPLPSVDLKEVAQRTTGDKKNYSGTRRFILLSKIGEAVVVDDVADAEVIAALTTVFAAGAR